ncbi:unnamed protein product [Nezara viridula]|uniref:Uncharacterized protein n=1 Tax=Nezara viridula TaxID=85310 RepID=A0A9P0GXI6_NEZVI|nr:unnamed protein product [Nezara viridula]
MGPMSERGAPPLPKLCRRLTIFHEDPINSSFKARKNIVTIVFIKPCTAATDSPANDVRKKMVRIRREAMATVSHPGGDCPPVPRLPSIDGKLSIHRYIAPLASNSRSARLLAFHQPSVPSPFRIALSPFETDLKLFHCSLS